MNLLQGAQDQWYLASSVSKCLLMIHLIHWPKAKLAMKSMAEPRRPCRADSQQYFCPQALFWSRFKWLGGFFQNRYSWPVSKVHAKNLGQNATEEGEHHQVLHRKKCIVSSSYKRMLKKMISIPGRVPSIGLTSLLRSLKDVCLV